MAVMMLIVIIVLIINDDNGYAVDNNDDCYEDESDMMVLIYIMMAMIINDDNYINGGHHLWISYIIDFLHFNSIPDNVCLCFQSLFHLPVFRKLVLNCELPAIENKESKVRCCFSYCLSVSVFISDSLCVFMIVSIFIVSLSSLWLSLCPLYDCLSVLFVTVALPPIWLSVCLSSLWGSIYPLCVYLWTVCLSSHVSILDCLAVQPCVSAVCLFIHFAVYLLYCMSVCLSSFMSLFGCLCLFFSYFVCWNQTRINPFVTEYSYNPCYLTQKDVTRLSFMHELRKLFALLIGSKRKYVDPTKAVEVCHLSVVFFISRLLSTSI